METISNMEYLKPTEIDRIRLTLLYLLQASPHPKSASTNLSRAQYELQFKKWGFRKYWTKDEWVVVDQKIEKRKREHKESEVYIDGILIESKKVKRTTLRYAPTPAAIEMHLQAPSPRTPEGIIIRTPLPTHATHTPVNSLPAPVCCTPTPVNAEPVLMDYLPFMQFKSKLSREASFGSSILRSGSSSSMIMSQDVCSGIIDQFIKEVDREKAPGCLSQTVKALMPENVFSNRPMSMQMTGSQGHQSSVLNFLNLTMFLVSNNFFGARTDVSKRVYEWVKRRSNVALLDYLLSISGPTAESLAENLFRLAIDADDVRTVKKIIKSGIDPNEQVLYHGQFGSKRTPLQRACEMRSLELVRVLLEAGADVNSTAGTGYSALGLAVSSIVNGSDIEDDLLDTELVRTLLDAGAKVNTSGAEFSLFYAARSGNAEIVALLISAGADVNFLEEYFGDTPLMQAVTSEDYIPDEDVCAIVRNLLHAGADAQATAVYDDGKVVTVLEAATSRGSIELIQLLLDGGARITESAFLAAVKNGKLNIVKLLLRSGAQVSRSVIEGAAENRKPKLVMFLLHSAEDSIKDQSSSAALISAIHKGNMDVIDALDASGVHLNTTSKLPAAMAAAADRGDISVFRLLLGDNSRYRASVIGSLHSSLHAAIAKGRNDITDMLLAAGVAVDAGNDRIDESPLLAAIHRKDAHLAQKLLDAGAAVNGRDLSLRTNKWLRGTFTVLPAAVAWGYHPLIRNIISAGAEVNAPECEGGKTALVVAVEKGDTVTIQILIDAGADVNASAAVLFGYTALEAAVRNNDIDMVDYLFGIGADTDERSLIAAVSRSVELMQMLLAARLRRYQRHSQGYGCEAPQVAIGGKNNAMVEILLANGVDTNTIIRQKLGNGAAAVRKDDPTICYRESAFGTAIKTDKSNDLSIVRMLLRGGADLKSIVIESPDLTALLAGINQKNLPLVNTLIAAGAEVNASVTGSISHTPLQLAVEKGRMDIVHTLLEHGADVNAPPHDRYGATALQFAAIGGYVGIANLLLERGAEVNAPPAKVGGRTALEGAAEHGRIDMLELLLSAGAQIIGPGGEQYERARELASKNGHIAARHLLESYKAQWLETFAGLDLMATDVGVLNDLQF